MVGDRVGAIEGTMEGMSEGTMDGTSLGMELSRRWAVAPCMQASNATKYQKNIKTKRFMLFVVDMLERERKRSDIMLLVNNTVASRQEAKGEKSERSGALFRDSGNLAMRPFYFEKNWQNFLKNFDNWENRAELAPKPTTYNYATQDKFVHRRSPVLFSETSPSSCMFPTTS